MATSTVIPKQSFLEKLTQTVYLDYVLKLLGIIMFALALFKGWHSMGIFTKFLLVSGPIAWYVGARFNKVYR
jgi:hypothetical protein